MKPYYEADGITIYHADCRELIDELKPDAVLTDPPFFAPAVHYSSRIEWGKSWGDAMMLGQWWEDTLKAVDSVPSVATFCDSESYPVFYPAMYRRFERLAGVVWDKGRIGMGTPWRHSFELVLHGWNGTISPDDRGQGDVIRISPVSPDEREHPAEKPNGLLRLLLGVMTSEDDVVLDPFMGSGSTLRAAKDLRRHAIGIEIEERYCEIAARRLGQEVLDLWT